MNSSEQSITTSLYRNAEGHEVWKITDAAGRVLESDISSDHDMVWLLAHHKAAGDR